MEYTEEEKEAIEDLGTFNYLLDDVYSANMLSDEEVNKYEKSIHIVLNLIEKQQKEIEALKQENEYLNCVCESDVDNYIPKEAIRDLKKKLEDKSKKESVFLFEVINMIKELLGE